MIEKEFVPYEEALALKELGFDEPCIGYHDLDGLQVSTHHWYPENKNSSFPPSHTTNNPKISAPTFSQAFRWVREMGLDQKIERESEGLYIGFYWNGVVWEQAGAGSYEEAELACLRKLIDCRIVKKKNK